MANRNGGVKCGSSAETQAASTRIKRTCLASANLSLMISYEKRLRGNLRLSSSVGDWIKGLVLGGLTMNRLDS